MRLRDSRRVWLERLCRGGALAALGLLFVVVAMRPARAHLDARGPADIARALPVATLHRTTQLDVRLTEVPDEGTRAWLRALRAAGTAVRWHADDSLAAAIISSEPIAGPDHPRRITLAGVGPGPVIVRDALGVIDSATLGSVGTRTVDARASGSVIARVRGATLEAPGTDSVRTRAVLVIGRAGWESRFTTAALEEAGWPVETEFLITPRGAPGPVAGTGSAVRTRGATRALDTARYAAVIALDASAGARAGAIATFVRQGGGLILGPGADIGALRALAPARAGTPFRETLGGLVSAAPRRGLAGHALGALRDDALVLERRGPLVTMAARRHEVGRVVMLGYDDLWRWRMEGGEMAPDDHRAWWSALVSSVAFSPLLPVTGGRGDPAPLAALHASLGPSANRDDAEMSRRVPWAQVLLGVCILLLMIEWTSRRFRGAP